MPGLAPFSETSSSINISTMHGAVPQLQDYLEHSALRLPDKVALVQQDERVIEAYLGKAATA